MSTSGGTRSSSNARGVAGGAPREPAAVRNAREIAALHETSSKWQAEHPNAPEEFPAGGRAKMIDKYITKQEDNTLIHGRTLDQQRGYDLIRNSLHWTPRETVENLRELYGEHQLGNRLSTQELGTLRAYAKEQGIQSGGTRSALISRITAAATHGHYSADFGAKTKSTNSPEAKHTARMAKVEAQIARLQSQLEQMRQQGPAYKAPSRSESPRSQRTQPSNAVPRAESRLRQLDDPTSAHEALSKLAGGDIARLQEILRHEPTGVTGAMLRGLGGSVPRQTSKPGYVQADNLARLIAERLRTGS